MQYAFSFLALAAAVTALPQASSTPAQTKAISPNEFTMEVKIGVGNDVPVYPLVATTNGTAGQYILIGDRRSGVTGTPAFTTGELPTESLALDIAGKPYYPEPVTLGPNVRGAFPVNALPNTKDAEWTVEQTVVHKVPAGTRAQFFACDRTVNGATNIPVLSWGQTNDDGSYPDKCFPATIFRVCNAAGSSEKPEDCQAAPASGPY